MPLLITLIEMTVGMAVIAAVAMFILPAFFIIIGLGALAVVIYGFYRTYIAPRPENESPFAYFYRTGRRADETEDNVSTARRSQDVIEGEFKVIDEDRK